MTTRSRIPRSDLRTQDMRLDRSLCDDHVLVLCI